MLLFLPPRASLILRVCVQTRQIRKILVVAAAFVLVRSCAQIDVSGWQMVAP
jgi:hypothetical protein